MYPPLPSPLSPLSKSIQRTLEVTYVTFLHNETLMLEKLQPNYSLLLQNQSKIVPRKLTAINNREMQKGMRATTENSKATKKVKSQPELLSR